MPTDSYKFQAQINPETSDRVDCAITSAEGFIIPIDSKFYSGQYQSYQSASNESDRKKILRDLRTAILRDAENISDKYILQFHLEPGNLLIMNNYRTLHGRRSYNTSEGSRWLQGLYIDHDSAESKYKLLSKEVE